VREDFLVEFKPIIGFATIRSRRVGNRRKRKLIDRERIVGGDGRREKTVADITVCITNSRENNPDCAERRARRHDVVYLSHVNLSETVDERG
jgi:hypothetical protein